VALPNPRPDSTVVVTGASSGIGAAVARELAERGYDVTLVSRRRKALRALADELPTEAHVITADLTKDGDRTRLLKALREGPTVIGLCNNAGQASFGSVLDHDPRDEAAIVRVNVLAFHELAVELGRDMVQRGEGAILNAGSVTAFAPFPHNATYAATKAFVQSFSEALHTELSGTGVSCTVASFGPVRTEIWERSGWDVAGLGGDILWQDADEAARAAVDAMAAGRRTVTPGVTNQVAALAQRAIPRTVLLPLTRAITPSSTK
jgi:short-subunit dehydrogenase